MQAFDLDFNAAIVSISRTIFPNGFTVSSQSPTTYQELCSHLDAGRRMVVFDGGCENTIYADPAVNHALRAWHDYCHWTGGNDFSIQGEYRTWQMQCLHLYLVYGRSLRTRSWCQLLYAEIVGQRLYYEHHKRYVANQRCFVKTFLSAPDKALKCNISELSPLVHGGLS